MPKIDPSIEVIKNFTTPLTDGERLVLNYLYKNLSEHWEIYVQPPMNGLRPDVVLIHPLNGIVVIEVKDWSEQSQYWHDENEFRLYMKSQGRKKHPAPSQPIDQINLYKTEIKDFFSPSMLTSKHFSLITGVLVFTNWQQDKIEEVFPESLRENKKFSTRFPTNLIRGKKDLEELNIEEFLPCANTGHSYMSETIANELRNWVSSSEFDVEQTKFVRLNNIQSRLVHSRTQTGYRRVKGAAGSGKSVVLAARAAELARSNKKVLVLSFNITLKNYLRDLAVRYDRPSARNIEFLHYHGFVKRFCYKFGYQKKWKKIFANEQQEASFFERKDMSSDSRISKALNEIVLEIKNNGLEAFEKISKDAILVDEGQDFNVAWWNSLRNLLRDGGEMVLVADPTQDVYDSASKWTDEAMKGAGFSGNWTLLEDNYRLPRQLAQKTNEFANLFLPEKSEKLLTDGQSELFDVEPVIMKWENIPEESAVEKISNLILDKVLPKEIDKLGVKPLSMSDIVFLTPSNELGRNVVKKLTQHKIRVLHTFHEDDDIQRKQKLFFFKGSEKIKGSTIHSFKGLESRAIILYLKESKSVKDVHAAYAALTRLKSVRHGSIIYVLSSNLAFKEFGRSWQGQALYLQNSLQEISNNQQGISYLSLFGDCLEGAKSVELRDPYIKTEYQFINLEEFASMMRGVQSSQDVIELNLITGEVKNDDKWSKADQDKALALLKTFLKKNYNIEFSWERKNFHDRSIRTDHGWNITLGRGLDIFKPDNRSNIPQTERLCREFTLNFKKTDF